MAESWQFQRLMQCDGPVVYPSTHATCVYSPAKAYASSEPS
jgi:hypothetical protein